MRSTAIVILLLSPAWTHAGDFAACSVKTEHTNRESATSWVTQGGSGTVVKIEDGVLWVLSCAHVAYHQGRYGSGDLRVVVNGGVRLKARLAHHCPTRDLSLIRATVPPGVRLKVKAAKVANREGYKPGSRVVKSGFPGAGPRVQAAGECLPDVSMNAQDASITSLVATAPSRSGDSGGGVFRESDGKLVAVIWGGRDGKLWATKLREIRWLLAKARDAGTVDVD